MAHLVEQGILQDTCELVKPCWLYGNLNSAVCVCSYRGDNTLISP